MNTPRPTAEEINVFDSLDERHAVKNFLGKNLEQAESLFRENFLYYQEDLMFMGPKAFAYYVSAAIHYLLSTDSNGNATAVNAFCGLIAYRLDYEPDTIAPVGPLIHTAIIEILEHFDRFFTEYESCEDVAEQYRVLLSRLKS